MTSNGLILKENLSLVMDADLWHLNISVDGPSDIHDKIRGVPNGFKRTTEGISLLQEKKREMGMKNPRVCINCVITPDNVESLPDMVEIAREVGVDSLTFQHLMFTADEYEKNKDVDVTRLLESMERVENMKNGIPAAFFPRVDTSRLDRYYRDPSYEFGNFCITPWYRFNIFPNGEVRVCRQVLSNVRSGESLRAMWNGKKFRDFRKSLVKQGLYLPFCLTCCHRQYS